MADDLDLDFEDEQGQTETHPIDKRINKALADKAQALSERDEALKAKQTAETDKAAAQKEVEFFKNFSAVTTKYAGATEYLDQIKEKVLSGYDVEDAAISILAREGKLVNSPASFTPSPSPAPPRESPAGGSAPIVMQGAGGILDKSPSEMTQQERRAALIQAEQEEGAISKIFQARSL